MNRIVAVVALVALSAALLAPVARAQDIVVDASKQHQTIEGFGTCLVAWVADMRKLYMTEEFQKTYVETVGCNMLRVNMWGPVGDAKPQEDWRDISYKDFDMTANGGRGQIFIDFGRKIRALNPKVRIIGTVWSPPAWMKMNKSITGPDSPSIRATGYTRGDRVATNRVAPKYFPHYVKWMVEYMKMHRDADVPFYGVSIGNEVQFSQRFESCVWSGEDYAKVVAMLGKLMEAEGFGDVKIFGPETMTSHFYAGGTPQYFEAIAANPEAMKYFDVAATHGYEDGIKAEMEASSSAQLREFIAKWGWPLWMTEGGTGGHNWPEPLHKGVAAAIHNSLAAGNCSAFVPWQIASKEPNTHALMTIEKPTHKTYAAMHYFKFIPQDSVRIDTEPSFGTVKASAYADPKSRRLSIVLINDTKEDHPVRLALKNIPGVESLEVYRTKADETLKKLDPVAVKGGIAALTMPAESMATLTAIVK